jgi:hypothetical protein
MMGDAADKYPDCLVGRSYRQEIPKEYGSMETLANTDKQGKDERKY